MNECKTGRMWDNGTASDVVRKQEVIWAKCYSDKNEWMKIVK